MQRVQQDSVGVVFRAELIDQDGKAINLDGLTVRELVFLPPRGAARVRTAQVIGEPVNGVLEYVSVEGDIDQFGRWRYQPLVLEPGAAEEDPPVRRLRGLYIEFEVVENLDG